MFDLKTILNLEQCDTPCLQGLQFEYENCNSKKILPIFNTFVNLQNKVA